jgi:hypothetical protein
MGISNPALPGWADGLADGPPGLDGIWAGAKALKYPGVYGTAEAVPFVKHFLGWTGF